MIGRKHFSPVSFIRFRVVALAPLFLVYRWRYAPYPAQQQKTIKEKTKLNTIIWFTSVLDSGAELLLYGSGSDF